MARADLFSVLYAKKVSPLEFNWDTMVAPPLLSFLTPQDIYQLYTIAKSNKLASKPKVKYKMIDDIVSPRGFRKIASGTNRVVYKYLDDQRYCIKIAFDSVALSNNPMEFMNQFKLKPFVARVFEVSPCGTVALCERVEPITTREEFANIANDIYDLIVNKIIGKYVVDDIGSNFFQNYGIRLGVCPVLLDYPSVYELDGKKLYCNREDPITHIPCLGEIDYDPGFNFLVCTKCGKQYQARQLAKQEEDGNIVVKMEGVAKHMSIKLYRGDEVVETIERNPETKTIQVSEKKDEPKRSGIRIINKRKFDQRQERKANAEEHRQKRVEAGKEQKAAVIEERVASVGKIYDGGPREEEKKEDNVKVIKVSDMATPGRQRRFDRVDIRETQAEEQAVDDMVKRIQQEAAKEAILPEKDTETEPKSTEALNQANTVSDYKPEKVNPALQLPAEEDEATDESISEETAEEESTEEGTEATDEIVESAVEYPAPSWDNPIKVDKLHITNKTNEEVKHQF